MPRSLSTYTPGTRPRPDPIADPDDVPVVVGDVVEGRVAARDVAEDEDPVGVRLLEHRAVDGRDVRAPVDVAEKEPVAASSGGLVDARAAPGCGTGRVMSRMITPSSELRLPRSARASRFGL